MSDASLEQKLSGLLKEIDSVSGSNREKLVLLARRADNAYKKLNQNVDSLQEALDMLRIVIKYQCFDLEATRRENTVLKKLLEDYSR